MNLLFYQKNTYKVDTNLKDFKSEFIQKVLPYKEDFSFGLRGEFIDNEKFWLTNKLALVSKKFPKLNPAYLRGHIISNGNNIFVHTVVRPNYGLVVLFYVNVILFFLTAFRINTPLKVSQQFFGFFLLFMPLLIAVFFTVIRLASNCLIRKVEKKLNLKQVNKLLMNEA